MDTLFNGSPGANSMRNYFIEQSSNRYTVNGDVTDWVEVPGEPIDYDDNPDSNVWKFLQDSINTWYDEQIAGGKTPAQINDISGPVRRLRPLRLQRQRRLQRARRLHRHVPVGTCRDWVRKKAATATTIWSHSWYAHYELEGSAGPSFNMLGGIKIGRQRLLGRQVHHPARGRRRGRVHARVRARHGASRPVRLLRRERDRILDSDVVRLLDRRRQGHHR